MTIIFVVGAVFSRGAFFYPEIVGEEYAVGAGIALVTSFCTFLYSIAHVCCFQTVRGSKIHIFTSIISIAMCVCMIGAIYGSKDSFIEAQCSEKVDCHHAPSLMDGCNAGAKLCHMPEVDRDTLWGERQYYASWFLDGCWDHGGDDDHCRIFDTREQYMKFTNHATKCCDGISLSDAFEFTMLWSALPQIICALFRVMGTFLNLRCRH